MPKPTATRVIVAATWVAVRRCAQARRCREDARGRRHQPARATGRCAPRFPRRAQRPTGSIRPSAGRAQRAAARAAACARCRRVRLNVIADRSDMAQPATAQLRLTAKGSRLSALRRSDPGSIALSSAAANGRIDQRIDRLLHIDVRPACTPACCSALPAARIGRAASRRSRRSSARCARAARDHRVRQLGRRDEQRLQLLGCSTDHLRACS